LQIVGATPIMGAYQFAANASDSIFIAGKSRGSTSTAGAVTSGDALGEYNFRGDDGSTNGKITVTSAVIRALVDGAVSTGIVPGRLIFQTMNTGGTLAERMRLQSSGGLSLGITTDPGSGNLLVNGNVTTNTGGSSLTDPINLDELPCTATTSATSSTTLATVTGMTSATLTAGKRYRITGHLTTTSGASGGLKLQFTAAGGLTLTSGSINCFGYNGTTAVASTTTTAIGASCFAQTAIVTDVWIDGVILVNASGTLSLQMAQNASNGTTTSVLVNSYLSIARMNA
jgi:hypothetical protein